MGEVGPCPGPRACAGPRASEPLCETAVFAMFILSRAYCKLLPDANIMTIKWSNLKVAVMYGITYFEYFAEFLF